MANAIAVIAVAVMYFKLSARELEILEERDTILKRLADNQVSNHILGGGGGGGGAELQILPSAKLSDLKSSPKNISMLYFLKPMLRSQSQRLGFLSGVTIGTIRQTPSRLPSD